MKRRILSLVLSLVFVFTLAPARALAAPSGEEQYEKLMEIVMLIQRYGLHSSSGEDPLKDYLVALFEEDPDAFASIANGMLQTHDDKSFYIPPAMYDDIFPSQITYGGLGITILPEPEGFVIGEISSPGPSAESGLQVGDIIVSIGGADAETLSTQELVTLARGEVGTTVTFTVKRPTGQYVYTVTRGVIAVSNFYSEELEPGITYMRWTRFETLEAYVQFIEAYYNIFYSENKALILDLRGNPGGSVDLAYAVLDRIVPDAGIDLFALDMREDLGGLQVARSSGLGLPLNKIVILVDEGSASASELIAGSLRDLDYADVVGAATFGKATGQYHLALEDDSAVVLTTLAVLLPSGTAYDHTGIDPDYYVENEIVPYTLPEGTLALNLETEIYSGNYSDQATAINQRLAFLGLLDKPEYTFGRFDSDSLDALNRFQTAYGYPHTAYASKSALSHLNTAVSERLNGYYIVDLQLEKALELSREVLEDDYLYAFDQFGDPVPADSDAAVTFPGK